LAIVFLLERKFELLRLATESPLPIIHIEWVDLGNPLKALLILREQKDRTTCPDCLIDNLSSRPAYGCARDYDEIIVRLPSNSVLSTHDTLGPDIPVSSAVDPKVIPSRDD
jgi:hypothetical protein